MSHYMIERRYCRDNRDWLHELSPDTTTWAGARIAQLFTSQRKARRALAEVRRQARTWSTGSAFQFHIIHDRSALPSHVASTPIEPRTRAGSWSDFECRFQPVIRKDGSVIWHSQEIPRPIVGRHWWTVLDCDGRLYVAAGFRYVNRIGYIRTDIEWTSADESKEWRYD